jgi:hypothetical protein
VWYIPRPEFVPNHLFFAPQGGDVRLVEAPADRAE